LPLINSRCSFSPELKPAFTLQSVRDDAIKQLRDAGRLSSTDYERAGSPTYLEDILASVDATAIQNTTAAKARGVLKSLLERVGKFETTIDMLAQSAPQVFGLSLVGLIWGSLKILLTVSKQFGLLLLCD